MIGDENEKWSTMYLHVVSCLRKSQLLADKLSLIRDGFGRGVCNPFCVYLLPLENSEARVTVFLKYVSNCGVRAQQEYLWERRLFFVLLVSRLPSAVLDFHCLILYQQPRVLFILKFLCMVPLLLTVCKEDCGGVVKPHF